MPVPLAKFFCSLVLQRTTSSTSKALTFTVQLLDKLWSQASSLLPPGTCLPFLSRVGLSIPTARRFSSNVANTRSRAFRGSTCAQELWGGSNPRN